jgi:Flp pilus assembly protein CpaB
MPISPRLQTQSEKEHRNGFWLGLLIFAGLLGLSAIVVHAKYGQAFAEAKAGWNLVPVLVSSVDMKKNHLLNTEDISQRMIPNQFMNANNIGPDSAPVILKSRIRADILHGDFVLWSQFAEVPKVQVLCAAHSIKAGNRLKPSDVEFREVDAALPTPSWVRTQIEVESAMKRESLAPFRKGDPILFSQLAPEALP